MQFCMVLRGKKFGGIIKISAFVNDENMLCIEIKDNGKGMKGDTLNQIKEYINNEGLFDGNNIGIKNIINRVKLYYLGTAHIDIKSKEDKGTSMQLKLPYKEVQ